MEEPAGRFRIEGSLYGKRFWGKSELCRPFFFRRFFGVLCRQWGVRKQTQQLSCGIQHTVVVVFGGSGYGREGMGMKVMVPGNMLRLEKVGKPVKPFQKRALENRRSVEEQENSGNRQLIFFPSF